MLIDLAHDAHRILYAFYWIMMDILSALEEATSKVNGGIKLHLTLAYKRCNLIIEHLKIALEETGLEPDERLRKEELERIIGTLSIETLENIRDALKKLINELASSGNYNASWLSSKLTEFADIICIASGLLRALSNSLKNSQGEYIWRTRLILQIIAQDLEVIVNTHRYLASNPEMLAKDP